MTNENLKSLPDYLFETSWEVCNKVGGIYTVVSTKARTLADRFMDNFILIGPDVWKEIHQNPEFIEDKFLYHSWREKAESEGLKIKVGRWNISGNPVVILVDFTHYFTEKDKILAWLWETYALDSITGGWDYIEPVLFGYAAGKVIESFYNYNISHHDRVIAHFHEWMTGAGVLYLKNKTPQVGTVFTTHATVLGRAIAGNGLPLYKDMDAYDPNGMAKQFGLVSKCSLEHLSALNADCFTAVSEITGKECRHFLGKAIDRVTPNGFEDTFVPGKVEFAEKRERARQKLLSVAGGLFNKEFSKDTILIISSGRYEFRNKGIDLFIDAMGMLNKQADKDKEYIAFLTIPAYQSGPRKELLDRISNRDFSHPVSGEYLTHGLHYPDHDAILNRIRENGLLNRPEDKVKIIYVPAYLNGIDGIFDFNYYDLLIGFDGSVFPSYYEPWGYTPLESLVFHIPTITTSLAGFGLWIRSLLPEIRECITVIERTDTNDKEVVDEITKCIISCSNKSEKEIIGIRIKAYEISRSALWKNLAEHYYNAFSFTLEKVSARAELFKSKQPFYQAASFIQKVQARPEWKKVLINPSIPENLEGLVRLTKNLWWTWNQEGAELFEMIDSKRWQMRRNPIALLESLSYQELQDLSNNQSFLEKLGSTTEKFDSYMAEVHSRSGKQVAYFSMEFGLHDTLKIYSGGLGMLAGDYLKEASDSNFNIMGIGLLYRYGYFQQRISISGEQMEFYTPQKFTHMPLIPVRDDNGNWRKVTFVLPGRTIYAKIWRVDVGRVPLYLMDTDIEENDEADRVITHQLYGGDSENRLRQEILLGIGGIRMLNLLGIKPDIYHNNEGHSAFHGIERLRNLIADEHLTFHQAREVVRASTLFTTHTPVPAGHDSFSEDLMRQYLSHYADRLNLKWNDFMHLGKVNDNDPNEKFSMSILASKLSQEVNGVSRKHGHVTRKTFSNLYAGYYPEEIHIGYVTNGVHLPTWTADSWMKLYREKFGEGFLPDQSNPEYWKKIHEVDDDRIWKIHLEEKKKLTEYVINRLTREMTRRNENPKLVFKIRETFRPDALTIGFERRFATYKRAHMLFSTPERLAKIVNTSRKPVQFIFAGKAHPADEIGQDLIRSIYTTSKRPEFIGKIIFLENYDIELAKALIRGVDIWLNTPARPMEASGTSGEKAVMNGVINFSVLDGWWAEGYKPEAGWALKEETTYSDPQFQDELDAEMIYTILEEEIIPLFYERDTKKIPVKWVQYIKNTISEIAPHYTMKRQLDDYINLYYNKLFERSELINARRYEKARQIAQWKRSVIGGWESIEVVRMNLPDSTQKPLVLGDRFEAEIVLNLNELSGTDIGIEVLFGKKVNDVVQEPILIEEMKLSHNDRNSVTFVCNISIDRAGVYDYTFRIFPKNPLLPHRQDFSLVKWI